VRPHGRAVIVAGMDERLDLSDDAAITRGM
jgi:hypothetical protein